MSYFLILLNYLAYKRTKLSLSFVFIIVYSIVCYSIYKLDEIGVYEVKSKIGFGLFLLFFLIPLIFIVIFEKRSGYASVKIPVDRISIFIFKFILIGSLVSLAFFLPQLAILFEGDLSDSRNSIYESSQILGVFGLLMAFFAQCYPLTILGFFYGAISKDTFYSKYKWLFLLASLSYIIRVLAYVGRDGPIFYAFCFIAFYSFFRHFMEERFIKLIKLFGVAFFFSSLMILFGVTMSRFGNNSQNDALISVYDYAGQSIFNFSSLYNSNLEPQYGFHNFSLPFKLGGFDLISKDELGTIMGRFGLLNYVFYGSIGSLYMDFSDYIFFFFYLIIPFLIVFFFKRNFISIRFLLFIFLLVQLFLNGIFYYNLKSLEGNLFVVILFGLFIYTKPKNIIVFKE